MNISETHAVAAMLALEPGLWLLSPDQAQYALESAPYRVWRGDETLAVLHGLLGDVPAARPTALFNVLKACGGAITFEAGAETILDAAYRAVADLLGVEPAWSAKTERLDGRRPGRAVRRSQPERPLTAPRPGRGRPGPLSLSREVEGADRWPEGQDT